MTGIYENHFQEIYDCPLIIRNANFYSTNVPISKSRCSSVNWHVTKQVADFHEPNPSYSTETSSFQVCVCVYVYIITYGVCLTKKPYAILESRCAVVVAWLETEKQKYQIKTNNNV